MPHNYSSTFIDIMHILCFLSLWAYNKYETWYAEDFNVILIYIFITFSSNRIISLLHKMKFNFSMNKITHFFKSHASFHVKFVIMTFFFSISSEYTGKIWKIKQIFKKANFQNLISIFLYCDCLFYIIIL